MENHVYLCIDLKSFYASVECVERGLDPMTTNLVVADPERTDKTICLAVSPSMKALGVKNRCRVFEIPRNIDYIMAEPRMQKYIDYSAEIYGIYLRYLSKDDIHVYSIDEAFLDVTHYLKMYSMTAKEFGVMLMNRISSEIGVRSTCGIGTNLYLTKIALDITAKHSKDFIGYLDEWLYRESLWDHRPLTDFWRIGRGTARRLENIGIYTMGDIARADEDLLYRMFGIDAELLIDHAWGREPVTMEDIKSYQPKTTSLSSGQVLPRNYSYDEARIVIREMIDQLCLDMVEKGVVTSSVSVSVGYARTEGLPSSHGTAALPLKTSSNAALSREVLRVYDRITCRDANIRRLGLACNALAGEASDRQITLFGTGDGVGNEQCREHREQETVLNIKKRYGRNAVFKGMDLESAGTAIERNNQIGGHKRGAPTGEMDAHKKS